jgi:hypothetical protein
MLETFSWQMVDFTSKMLQARKTAAKSLPEVDKLGAEQINFAGGCFVGHSALLDL